MTEDDRGNMNYLKDYSKYSSLIFQMIIISGSGVWGGIELDKWLKMNIPVFTISLTVIMTFLAIFHLFRTLLKK